MDPHSRIYYVDHNTRTTAWERPQPLPPGLVTSIKFSKIQISCLNDYNKRSYYAPEMP